MNEARESMVLVRLNQPALGPDPRDGEEFLSNKHWLEAAYCIQNGRTTSFINFEGEVLVEWDSALIENVRWPDIPHMAQTAETQIDRYRRIKVEYPNAWKDWVEGEEEALGEEFERGESLEEICRLHQRAPGGIVARLRKLELVGKDARQSEVEELLNARRIAARLHQEVGAIEELGSSVQVVSADDKADDNGSMDFVAMHRFFHYESAGVTKKNRLMNNLTGSCSCGGWQKTMGSLGSLKASWQEHVATSPRA